MYLTCNIDFLSFRRACNLMNGVDKRATALYRGFLISIDGQLQVMATDGMRLAFSDPIPVKVDDQLKEPVFINLADPGLLQGYLQQLSTASVLSIDYDEKEEKVLMMFDDYDPESFSTHNSSYGKVRPSGMVRIRDNFTANHQLAWQLEGVTASKIWTYIKSTKSEVRQADRVYTLQISMERTGEAAVVADKSDCTFYTGKLSGLLADRNGQAVTYVRLSNDTLNLMYKALSSTKAPVSYYHYIQSDDADNVKHVWTSGGCHYFAMPIVTSDFKGDETQDEYLTRTNSWYGVKKKPVSAVPTPTKTKAAEQSEPAETVEPVEQSEPAETVTEPEPETTEPEPDFSALVLYSDKPVYKPSPYGTKHVKNRPVRFITVSGGWEGDYIDLSDPATTEPATTEPATTEPAATEPAAAAIPPIINPTRPELGDCLYKTAAFELYKNDALKRYRLVFRRHLSREERAFLFVNKWTWRREFRCYQWGTTKNGADAVKKTVEFFKK